MIDKALEATRESKAIDFKRSFDPANTGDWCETVKDIVAMANSGGGCILIGVEDDGTPAHEGAAGPALTLDPARITDKIARYTGVQFDGFALAEATRNGQAVCAIVVDGTVAPLVFEKPGTYPVGDGKQTSAFSAGSIYVRHGAKSEPATSLDLSRILERAVKAQRKELMANVRRVVNAPPRSQVKVLPGSVRQSDDSQATPIRITTDPAAPGYRLVDPDVTHPWRQKELLAEVNASVEPEHRINQFDIQTVRHLYDIDAQPQFFHRAKFGSSQYSPEFKNWLLGQYRRDPLFFSKAREEFARRRNG